MSESPFPEHTRDRLLQAALEIFSERGFREATVRDICARAGVNAASVNYYFRSKESLYAAALAYAFRQVDERYPLDALDDSDQPPEQRLTRFIVGLLYRLTDETHLGRHGKLIAREIADPTAALDPIVETVMKPHFRTLREILPQLLGPGWSQGDIDRCINSLIGQCLVYRHSRALVERLCPEIIAGPEDIRRTADFIVRFSLAALNGLARTGGSEP
jgi:AcrR family transcriptional regulator